MKKSVLAGLLFGGLLMTTVGAQAKDIPVPQPRPIVLAQSVTITTPGVYVEPRASRRVYGEPRHRGWEHRRHYGWRHDHRGRFVKRTQVRRPDGTVTTTIVRGQR